MTAVCQRHVKQNCYIQWENRELLQAVWGPDYGDEPEYLRVFMGQLRKKLELNPTSPRYLLTASFRRGSFQSGRT